MALIDLSLVMTTDRQVVYIVRSVWQANLLYSIVVHFGQTDGYLPRRRRRSMQKTKCISFNGMSLGEAMRANNISQHSFFGVKSDFHSKKEREAELLMADHFNGSENNFGFSKPIGVRTI